MFASGCGNALVGLQGMVNIMCNGTPRVSAQCTWAKLGGFEIMASATKGTPVSWSGWMHEFQQPSKISAIISRFFPMSPAMMVENFGMMPGFLTMYCTTLVCECRQHVQDKYRH